MGLNLNLGCGRTPMAGWVNLDLAPGPGIDVVADLDACRRTPLPFADDSVSQMRMMHVLEHIGDTLGLMQELHRIAEPGALLAIRSPYGSSDDAYEDPTHRQRLFVNSFHYFAQPTYWRADYGYRGDWSPERITLFVRKEGNEGLSAEAVMRRVNELRNLVVEIAAVLKAVKPIRAADRSLLRDPVVDLGLV